MYKYAYGAGKESRSWSWSWSSVPGELEFFPMEELEFFFAKELENFSRELEQELEIIVLRQQHNLSNI